MRPSLASVGLAALLFLGVALGLGWDRLPPVRLRVPFTPISWTMPPSLHQRVVAAEAERDRATEANNQCVAALGVQSDAIAELSAQGTAATDDTRRQLAAAEPARSRVVEEARKLAESTDDPAAARCDRWESSWRAVQAAAEAAGGRP